MIEISGKSNFYKKNSFISQRKINEKEKIQHE